MEEQSAIRAVPRRYEALAYILERIDRSGTSPSYGEIGRAMRPCIASTRVRNLVDQLVRVGVIERDVGSRRGIRIRDADRCRVLIANALGQHGWCHAQPLECLVPAIDGASTTSEWKEALWARFYMGAPRRQRSSVERYSIVKRA